MILLGAQYYRPPTPTAPNWAGDIKAMKAAGLNTVQLWAVWGWIEPEPGRFVFDDYDRIVERAHKAGMKVVISTITDMQPFWIPRVYPHAHMVDETGLAVRGTPREECASAITPGHCTDHPEIRDASVRFMRELAAHYKDAPALAAWDSWNETRWCVCCEHWVCYCDASLRAFRTWLRGRYGSLDALGEAWGQRLVSWDDVMPAKNRSFLNPSLLDWLRWLMHRADEMAVWRRDAIKAGDPVHPVSAHSPSAVIQHRGMWEEAPFARGNDFDFASKFDSFGTSAFPAWYHSAAPPEQTGYNVTLETTRSVASPRPFLVSELQGGAFSQGFFYGRPVSAALQQYWTWSAYGRGAKGVIYWSWSDETWGVESGGYGIDGNDGMAADRKKGLRRTRALLDAHASELEAYQPDPATVGVVFDSDSVLIAVTNRERNSKAATAGVNACLCELERQRVPFDVLDGRSLTIPKAVRLLMLPATFTLKEQAAEEILAFVRRGGWVYCEAGTGVFRENGFFIERAEDRPLTSALGIGVARRRSSLEDAACTVPAGAWKGSRGMALQGALWSLGLTVPKDARVIAHDAAGDPMLVEVKAGKGRVIMSGTFPSHEHDEKPYKGFADLVASLVEASGASPRWRVTDTGGAGRLGARTGIAGAKRLFFVFNSGEATEIEILPGEACGASAREWVTGGVVRKTAAGTFTLRIPGPGHRVLEWPRRG